MHKKQKEINCHYPKDGKILFKKKGGVDTGDQQLRAKTSFVDNIRCHGWNRKWGMHGVLQVRLNSKMCWKDLNDIITGNEPSCKKWVGAKIGGGKIDYCFQLGLIKGLIKKIQQYKNAHPRRAVEPREPPSVIHNIVD